jgi:hypothetical protein
MDALRKAQNLRIDILRLFAFSAVKHQLDIVQLAKPLLQEGQGVLQLCHANSLSGAWLRRLRHENPPAPSWFRGNFAAKIRGRIKVTFSGEIQDILVRANCSNPDRAKAGIAKIIMGSSRYAFINIIRKYGNSRRILAMRRINFPWRQPQIAWRHGYFCLIPGIFGPGTAS